MSQLGRVLVVDDNATNVELARYCLEVAGIQVDCAHDAISAQRQIAARPPDLILLDVQMPVVSGLELMRQLREDPLTRHIVVIIFTAYAMKGDEKKMHDAGCDGYITKPIDVRQFARVVQGYLPAR